MKRIIILFFVAVLFVGLFSCGKDNSAEKKRQNELALLDAYMIKNYPKAEPTKSGLYYIEEKKGTGDTIVAGDKVLIYYATWELDGKLIDESTGYTAGYRYEPYEVNVGAGNSITGLEEGLTYMQTGTVATLIINSRLAYGENGNMNSNPVVLGFTTLRMQVEVYKVYKAK